MSEIKRWDIAALGNGFTGMKHRDDGAFVRNSDHEAEVARLRAEVEGLFIASRNLVRSLEETYAISADDSDDRIYDELPSSSIATAYFNARDAVTNAKGEVP